MPAYTSPDVRNISVGTGFIEFKREGTSTYRHVGNVPSFSFRIRAETLDHFMPINGMTMRDYTWTIGLEAEVEIEMEEITAQNLQMMLLGDITTAGGSTQVDIAAQAAPAGALRYTATNEVGPRWSIDLHLVTFNGDKDYEPLASGREDFNKISLRGSALAVNGSFGVMTLI